MQFAKKGIYNLQPPSTLAATTEVVTPKVRALSANLSLEAGALSSINALSDLVILADKNFTVTGGAAVRAKINVPIQSYPYSTTRMQLVKNVAVFSNSSSTTGSFLITLPNPITTSGEQTFVCFTVRGFDYNLGKETHLVISGYAKSTLPMWANYAVHSIGNSQRFTSVRFGEDSLGRPVIVLGEDATSMSYPRFWVDADLGWAGADVLDYGDGWTITGPFLDAQYTAAGVVFTDTVPVSVGFQNIAQSVAGIYCNCNIADVRGGRTLATRNGGAIEVQGNDSDSSPSIVFWTNLDNDTVTTDAIAVGSVLSSGAWTWGNSTNTPYSSFHTTYKNIWSGTPGDTTDANGSWWIGANAFQASGRQPTRLSGLTGCSIQFRPSTTDTTASIKMYMNLAAESATTPSTAVLDVTANGAWIIGPVSGASAEHKIQNAATAPNYVLILQKNTGADTLSNNYLLFSTNTNQQGYIWNDGSNNIGLGTLSDISLKEKIREYTGIALDRIKALRPVTYDWISGASRDNIGFIAQDFRDVFPRSVSDNQGKLGITFSPEYHATVVKAIQEQQEMIEGLKNEIAEIKSAGLVKKSKTASSSKG